MLFRIPPALPTTGKRFRALYEWLNRLREAVLACQMQIPHNMRSTQGHQGVLLEGNDGTVFRLPPGIAVREMSVCQKVDNGDGTTTTKELFVRGLFSVVYDKDADGNPIDSDGNKLDETTDPPLPDLTGEDETSGFEISVT